MTDDQSPYFGAILNDKSLFPDGQPLLGHARFADWLEENGSTCSACLFSVLGTALTS